MVSPARWLISGTVAAAMVWSLAAGAHAATSRSGSLFGNAIVEDVRDVWVFPQLALDYRNLIMLQMGDTFSSGDAMLIVGTDTMALAISAHRSDNIDPLSHALANGLDMPGSLMGAQRPPGLTQAVAEEQAEFSMPHTLVDFTGAFDLGAGRLGVRLGFANGGVSDEPDGQDPEGNSTTTILLQVGYGFEGDFSLDTSLFASIGLGSQDIPGTDGVTGTDLRVGIQGRAYSKLDERISLAFLSAIGVRSYAQSQDPAPGSGQFDWDVRVGAGPAYHLKAMNAVVAAYAIIGASGSSFDEDDSGSADDASSFTLTLPAVVMSLELHLTDWLLFRGGAGYTWTLTTTSNDPGDSTGETSGSFGWAAGFGVEVDTFTLDWNVTNSWWTQGPDFVGGDGAIAHSVTAGMRF